MRREQTAGGFSRKLSATSPTGSVKSVESVVRLSVRDDPHQASALPERLVNDLLRGRSIEANGRRQRLRGSRCNGSRTLDEVSEMARPQAVPSHKRVQTLNTGAGATG